MATLDAKVTKFIHSLIDEDDIVNRYNLTALRDSICKVISEHNEGTIEDIEKYIGAKNEDK